MVVVGAQNHAFLEGSYHASYGRLPVLTERYQLAQNRVILDGNIESTINSSIVANARAPRAHKRIVCGREQA